MAFEVVRRADELEFDKVKLIEGEPDQPLQGLGNDAVALMGLGDPIPEQRALMLMVDRMEGNCSDKLIVVPDAEGRRAVRCAYLDRPVDEGLEIGKAMDFGYPGEPLPQVLTVALYQIRELGSIFR